MNPYFETVDIFSSIYTTFFAVQLQLIQVAAKQLGRRA